MRIEFYKDPDTKIESWDVQENGESIVGEELPREHRVYGYYVHPDTVIKYRPLLEDVEDKDDFIHWMITSRLVPKQLKSAITGSVEDMKELCSSFPKSFSSSITSIATASTMSKQVSKIKQEKLEEELKKEQEEALKDLRGGIRYVPGQNILKFTAPEDAREEIPEDEDVITISYGAPGELPKEKAEMAKQDLMRRVYT